MDRQLLEEHITHGSNGFPFGLYRLFSSCSSFVITPLHYHREFEILLVEKGAARIQTEGRSRVLSSGQSMFVNSGLLHAIHAENDDPCELIAFVFSSDLIAAVGEKAFDRDILPLMKNVSDPPPLLGEESVGLLREVAALYDSRVVGRELLIKSDLIRVMVSVAQSRNRVTEAKPNPRSETIKEVLSFIKTHYAEEITLETLANHVHLSREHLCRLFSQVADTSPVHYLNRYRILQSAYLLNHTERGISEISSACGFNNSSYFNKQFQRYMNCTPTEYRRNENESFSGTHSANKGDNP